MTSRQQRLITKEHIATHTNLILPFKPALYSSTLVIKCFKLRNPHGTSTFKTEALCLVSNIQLIKRSLPCNEQQIQCYLALLWQ